MKFISTKHALLLALVFQNAALVLMIRYTRTRRTTMSYIASTVVVTSECLKIVFNLLLEFFTNKHKNSTPTLPSSLSAAATRTTKKGFVIIDADSIKMTVPAFLYVVQNNLLFVALENLSVPAYQVMNQGKLLTTALFSRFLLDRNISKNQYLSLVLLGVGVGIVQLSSINDSSNSDQQKNLNEENYQTIIGSVAILSSCITSGLAAVYFEKVVKSLDGTSVYARNSQLAFWSIVMQSITIAFRDREKILDRGFFSGYDIFVIIVIICQAVGGLLVGLVVKYADSISKGFAISVAVVLSTIISIIVFDIQVDEYFVVGATMVAVAVMMYNGSSSRYYKFTCFCSLNMWLILRMNYFSKQIKMN